MHPAHPTERGTPPAPLFSAAELETLHAQDRQAGRNVVILLTAVFLIGLIMYSCIALIVA